MAQVMIGKIGPNSEALGSRFCAENAVSRACQSGQVTAVSGTYIIAVMQYIYMWLILQVCGRFGPTGTHETLFSPHNLGPRLTGVPFYGGYGLLTSQGVAKPAYRAFEMLNTAGDQRIPVTLAGQEDIFDDKGQSSPVTVVAWVGIHTTFI